MRRFSNLTRSMGLARLSLLISSRALGTGSLAKVVPSVSLLVAMPFWACSQSENWIEFEGVSVSDPKVVGTELHVQMINDTGEELCYFEDGLAFGPGVIEGNAQATELGQGYPADTLEEIKFGMTRSYDFSLQRVGQGKNQISLEIDGEKPIAFGDDVAFDIIFCRPKADGKFHKLSYSSVIQ